MTWRAPIVVATMLMSLSACSGDAPSVTMPTGPTFTLSGIVFQRTPIGTETVAGIWVAEANSHKGVLTDANGLYSLSGLSAGSASVSASGTSYYVATVTFDLTANVTKDIEIVKV